MLSLDEIVPEFRDNVHFLLASNGDMEHFWQMLRIFSEITETEAMIHQ